MNKVILEIEVETLDGKVYQQPFCRMKTTGEGNIQLLIKEDGHWKGVKGKVTIKGFKLVKEYYSAGLKKRIPVWLIKLFGVNI